MKFSEIIPRKNEITEGLSETFIADQDFAYNGLPILSGALVHYDAEDKIIYVNKIPVGGFNDIIRLLGLDLKDYRLNRRLPLNEVESDCPSEVRYLEAWQIWHNSHFDGNVILESEHQFYLDRVKKERTLQYSGFTFSSVTYSYSFSRNKFHELISTSPIVLKKNNAVFNLDGYLHLESFFDGFYINPLEVLIYQGFPISAPIKLYENGTLNAALAEAVLVKVINKNNYLLNVSKGQTIDILSSEMAEMTIFWDDSDRPERITMELVKPDQKST